MRNSGITRNSILLKLQISQITLRHNTSNLIHSWKGSLIRILLKSVSCQPSVRPSEHRNNEVCNTILSAPCSLYCHNRWLTSYYYHESLIQAFLAVGGQSERVKKGGRGGSRGGRGGGGGLLFVSGDAEEIAIALSAIGGIVIIAGILYCLWSCCRQCCKREEDGVEDS